MEKWQVLIVDEDERILRFEESAFPDDRFQVEATTSFRQAWQIFQKQSIQLVICELDNFDLLEKIRAVSRIPILIVSQVQQEKARIRAFQKEADDFMVKPFNAEELRLRAERLLYYFYVMTQTSKQIERYQYEFFDLDVVHRELMIDGKKVGLTAREFALLAFLVQTPKQICSRRECLQKVWHYTYLGEERIVDACIQKIREKLAVYSEIAAESIVTVWKKGYMFDPEKMKK